MRSIVIPLAVPVCVMSCVSDFLTKCSLWAKHKYTVFDWNGSRSDADAQVLLWKESDCKSHASTGIYLKIIHVRLHIDRVSISATVVVSFYMLTSWSLLLSSKWNNHFIAD